MPKKAKRKSKKKNKKRNIIICAIIIIFLIGLLCTFLILKFNKKTPVPKISYYTGELYSANMGANMLDSLSNGTNIVISPLNIDTSLAIIYNGSDNDSALEIKKYFNSSKSDVNDVISTKLNNQTITNNKSKNKAYEAYIKELYDNKYNELTIQKISKLSQAEKEKIILLLLKIDLSYTKLTTEINMSIEDISNYKLNDKEKKYTKYTIKNLIDTAVNNYETYEIINNINIYHEIFYNQDEKIVINDKYQKQLKELYNTNITGLKYSDSENSKNIINNNIKNNSYGNITRVLSETDLLDTNLIMINSLSFNYEWEEVFNNEETSDEEFFDVNNEPHLVEMMYKEEYSYFENELAVGFAKPFKDNDYSFIAVLPKEKGDFQASSLNLDGLLTSIKESPVIIGLPKFSFQSTNDLKTLYNKYNIADIYEEKANLSPMSDNDLYYSKTIEKNYITIGEKGTIMSNVKTSSLSAVTKDDAKKRIILNRPFIFLIRNNNTGEILLMGRVEVPTI